MVMENSIIEVVKAARARFGEVMSVSLKEHAPHGDFYFVACKRDQSPTPYPYMTITAKLSKEGHDIGQVSFFWGHYDLTLEKVHAQIEQHKHAA
jgi:hypothetical protein